MNKKTYANNLSRYGCRASAWRYVCCGSSKYEHKSERLFLVYRRLGNTNRQWGFIVGI